MQKDFIYHGRLEGIHVAFTYALTTSIANRSVVIHDCDPVSAHLYGRALTSALLVAQYLRPEEKYNVCWKYEGAARTVVVDVKGDNGVRGFISPSDLSIRVEDAEELYGDSCTLAVVRSMDGRTVNAGNTRSQLQDVVDDLAFYFSYSDQVETEMCVMIGFEADAEHPVTLCQGLMIQALPDCDLNYFQDLRTRLGREPLRSLLAQPNETDNYFEELIHALLEDRAGEVEIILDERPAPYLDCTCDDAKMDVVVNALPREDRLDIAQTQEAVRIHCEFCNKTFSRSASECQRLWDQ
ncbi:MAG: redox-regulated HSP33 family molecular chaperone [Kiritimatiellia bacterium]|jgi:molecular chaperone Hsp33